MAKSRKWQIGQSRCYYDLLKASRGLMWYPTPLMQMQAYSRKVKRFV